MSDDCTASFRDPAGRLIGGKDRLLRLVHPSGVRDCRRFLGSAVAAQFLQRGSLAATRILDDHERTSLLGDPRIGPMLEADGSLLLEHERIPFPSYPSEWAPEMLHAAGALTLELATALLPQGLGLKDATPYNVLFRGPEPVFVDLLSFESRNPHDPTWRPYAQFVRTFLLPLLAYKYFHIPLDEVFLTRRDGLEPETVYRWAGRLRRWCPPFLSLVSVPTWLGRSRRQDAGTLYSGRRLNDPQQARFILERLFHRQERVLRRLRPPGRRRSAWSHYLEGNAYTADQFSAKEAFVNAALAQTSPRRVLDVGSNTGHFSALAAAAGARVVAIDSDPVVAGRLWARARAARLDILPLVVNIARPTPGVGWRNRECDSFLERAKGQFDLVLLLAVIHHLAISERIPLEDIFKLAAELTTRLLIAEFVGPGDPMFRRLLRGRDELYAGLTGEFFERCCRRWFRVIRAQSLPGCDRRLYLLEKAGS